MGSWWERKRLARVRASVGHVIGDDPARKVGLDAEVAQSMKIATFVKECFDGGFDPVNMVRMLLSGACYVGDNSGISREQMIQVIQQAGLQKDRQLVYTPGD